MYHFGEDIDIREVVNRNIFGGTLHTFMLNFDVNPRPF